MVRDSIIGYGEVGQALYSILEAGTARYYDLEPKEPTECTYMHICMPCEDNFVEEIRKYVIEQSPDYIVIHSSVPVGTSELVERKTGIPTFHSPVRGTHDRMKKALLTYDKYLSHNKHESGATAIAEHLGAFGFKMVVVENTKRTELAKLLELCRYGTYLAFAKEQEAICDHFGLSYEDVVTDYDKSRNAGLFYLNQDKYMFPLLTPFKDYIGGHCTVEDMSLMLGQVDSPLLEKAHEIGWGTVIWGNCNIYPTVRLGKGCSVGHGTEIGHNVRIGDRVRIGAQCFIPEGVTIEDDVFIAPKVTFSNDKHPPSNKENWGKVTVKKGAAIGMGSIILPCCTIGEGAMVGAGSVVTKNVPAGEVWYGEAAKPHGKR